MDTTEFDLLSVAGITVAAGIVTAVVRAMWETISRQTTRQVAILSGILLSVAAYATGQAVTVLGATLAVLNGGAAGLAAIAAADRIRAGPDYKVAGSDTTTQPHS